MPFVDRSDRLQALVFKVVRTGSESSKAVGSVQVKSTAAGQWIRVRCLHVLPLADRPIKSERNTSDLNIEVSMENQIDQLREEVAEYQSELQKLKNELSAAKAIAPQPKSDRPSDISEAYRNAAKVTAEKIVGVEGVEDAIAALEGQLAQKLPRLKELEKEQKRQMRLKRIEEGRTKIRGKSKDIEAATESLQLLFCEMIELSDEYQSDFAELYPAGDGEKILNIARLLNFSPLLIPQLIEKQGRFTFGSVQWTK